MAGENPLVDAPPAESGAFFNAGTGDNGWATGISIAESAMDTYNGIKDGDWVQGGLGMVGLAADAAAMAIDPFGTLMSSAASFLMEHVQPLKDMLDWLAGNPPVIESYSATWNNVATELGKIAEDYNASVASGTRGWTGAAAENYQTNSKVHGDALAGAASAAGTVGTVVGLMGMVVAFVREVVRDLIADLVGKLIAWVLEAAFTLGFGTPVIVAQAVTAISRWAAKIAKIIQDLLDTIKKVSPMLKRLVEVFEKIMKVVGKLAGKATGLDVLDPKNIKRGGFFQTGGGPDVDVPSGSGRGNGTSPSGSDPDTPSSRPGDTTSTSGSTTAPDAPTSRPGRGDPTDVPTSSTGRPGRDPDADGPPRGNVPGADTSPGGNRPLGERSGGPGSNPSPAPGGNGGYSSGSGSGGSGSGYSGGSPSNSGGSYSGTSPGGNGGGYSGNSPGGNGGGYSGTSPGGNGGYSGGGTGSSGGGSGGGNPPDAPNPSRTDHTSASTAAAPDAPPRADHPNTPAPPRDPGNSPQGNQPPTTPAGGPGAPAGGGAPGGGSPAPGGRPGGGGWTGTPGSRGDLGSGVPSPRGSETPRPSSFGPSSTGPSHAGPTHSGPAHNGPAHSGPAHAGPPQNGPSPFGPSGNGPSHSGPGNNPPPARPGNPGPAHTGPGSHGPSHTPPGNHGPSHAGPGGQGPSHAGPPQQRGGPLQNGPSPSTHPDNARSRGGHPDAPGRPHPNAPAPHNQPRPHHDGPPAPRHPDANPPHRPDGPPAPRRDPDGTPGQHRAPEGAPAPRRNPDGWTQPHRDTDTGPRHRQDPGADQPHNNQPHNDRPDTDPPHNDQPNADQPRTDQPDIDEAHARHGETTPAGISHHRGDPDMGDLPHRVPADPRYFTADVHVTPDGRARIGNHTYTPEQYGDLLRRNGWDGRTPIRLIGCDAGSNDFANRLSRHTGADVLAPTKPAWTDANGRVYTSDATTGPDGNRHPRIPPTGEWHTHHPDGATTRTGEDGYAPGTSDDHRTGHDDPDGAVDRGSPSGTSPDPDDFPALPDYDPNTYRQDVADIVRVLDDAGRPDLARKFHDLAHRQVDGGNVDGLEDWMDETAPRSRNTDPDIARAQVLDKAAELTVLDRLSDDISGDPDLTARFNPGGPTGASFDIHVEDAGGNTVRRVEVERVAEFPETPGDLHSGSLHGADKADAPVPNRLPTAESAAVVPTVPPGGHRVPLGPNEKVYTGGLEYEIRDQNGDVRKTGNLGEDLARDFNRNRVSHHNLPNLDAVNILDDGGNLLGRLIRDGGEWKWVQ
ncbi:hypothetical protein [Saccharothrix sp. HUAS TT1]|uniref:hypothetical protein n=1 Tax=unclassified Saccharothrix TaxID=2593673 RepID=UPI00345BBA34